MNKYFNLQWFADEKTVNVTTQETLSPEMKTYYEKKLITLAEPELVFDQFAQKKPIPKNGGKTIEFRKYEPLNCNPDSHKLQEGITPKGQELSVSALTSTVEQYGDYVTISDVLSMTAIDNNIVEATNLIGTQAGRTLNKVTRNFISAGTNVRYAPSVAADGTITKLKFRTDLTKTSKLTPSVIRKAANDLKRQNAPKIDGSYVAIIHPDVATELMSDKEWIDVHKYEASANIFDGEIGKLAGVRFIENTEAPIWNDETCPANTDETTKTDHPYLAVYGCLFFGLGAYGTTEIEGGGLQHIVKPLGAGDDPLNQRATVGWKAVKTAEILVKEYLVRVEVCTDESDEVKSN